MGLVDHARRELERAGLFDPDSDYGGESARAALRLVEVFAEQGHSGASAGLVAHLFRVLSGYGILTPLTGEPDEWNEVGDGVFQNRRLSSVFKDGADGEPYDIDAVVVRYPDGGTFSGGGVGREYMRVQFPYTQPREPRVVDVDENGRPTE